MPQRTVEEVFRTIAPSRQRGVPNAEPISTAVTESGGSIDASLSQAAAEIAQLRATWQQQAQLISANTQAVTNNTSSRAGQSGLSTAANVAGGVFGGALGFLSPIVSGILHLFGGGNSQQATTLPIYTPPPPVSIGGILYGNSPGAEAPSARLTPEAATTTQTTYAPQITVNVSAMDSQSFMDRSSDIASAVRQAMLNNHPINGVVADL